MNWLSITTRTTATAAFLLIAYTGLQLLHASEELDIASPAHPTMDKSLPKGSFLLDRAAYDAIGVGPLALQIREPTIHLPNLKNEIRFLGSNRRPDADPACRQIQIGFKNQSESCTLIDKTPCYLTFQQSGEEGLYLKADRVSSLSITPELIDDERVRIHVAMSTPDGRKIEGPNDLSQFELQVNRTINVADVWMIGEIRVDSSLLARQRARWYGHDLFLENHGGEEYAFTKGRERIEFGEGDECYRCYLKEGEGAIFKEGRWQMAEGQTESYPYLFARKVDEKVMLLDLWDVEGKRKVAMSIMRTPQMATNPTALTDLQFVGVKTFSQFLFQYRAERLLIGPGEWLLRQEAGWLPLRTECEIDAYVYGALLGELLVIESLGKREGEQIVTALLYNAQRSEVKAVEFPLMRETSMPQIQPTVELPCE